MDKRISLFSQSVKKVQSIRDAFSGSGAQLADIERDKVSRCAIGQTLAPNIPIHRAASSGDGPARRVQLCIADRRDGVPVIIDGVAPHIPTRLSARVKGKFFHV